MAIPQPQRVPDQGAFGAFGNAAKETLRNAGDPVID